MTYSTIQVTEKVKSGHLEDEMSIFTLEKRTQIQEKLLEVGVALMKEKGMQKMTISEVTARTGIGKGTFYHFYPAKEFYIHAVIMYSKEGLKKSLNEIVEREGGINRRALEQILSAYSFHGENNIINAISAEDEKWLNEKLPKEYILDVPKEEQIVSALLQNFKDVKGKPDIKVIANMMKIMALAVENKYVLHEDVLDENLKLMREMLCDYIFGKEEGETAK